MKYRSHLLLSAVGILIFMWMMPGSAHAVSRTLSMPTYLANPGSILEVPVMLDNASGLAGMRVQINFNPEVLELQDVSAGPLGGAFEFSYGNGEGFVQLVLARAESLTNGTGRLAVLKFKVNTGAVQDLYSELAIADLDLADSTGVIDLRQKDTLIITNGMVNVTLAQNIDNAHNGLPDWWEQQYGMSPLAGNANSDLEHDGMSNLLEYAFGGKPAVADAHQRGVQMGVITVGDERFLSIGFYRRVGDSSLSIRVQETEDLSLWNDLNLSNQIMGPPQNMGDGTEYISVRGTIPVSGLNAEHRGFLRVLVERP